MAKTSTTRHLLPREAASQNEVLVATDLRKSYGQREALGGLSFSLRAGRVLGFIYTGALCITVSAPIRDMSDKIVGVLGVDIRFEELAKLEETRDF